MSVTVSTPAEILKSPLNTSTSKFQYSFSKARRMPDIKTSNAPAFYDLPVVQSHRSTTLGYGYKFDFTKSSKNVPSPNTYYLKDQFKDGKKGRSFGLSRENIKASGLYLGEKSSPGPAAYDVREINKTKISFSFRPRIKKDGHIDTPGPGNYASPTSLNSTGNYFFSKFKNSGVTSFAPPRSHRFPVSKEGDKPGPGAYQSSEGFSKTGSYFVSKLKSSLGRTFGTASSRGNLGFKNVSTPGPGSYRIPSDFGYYESSRTHRPSTQGK